MGYFQVATGGVFWVAIRDPLSQFLNAALRMLDILNKNHHRFSI